MEADERDADELREIISRLVQMDSPDVSDDENFQLRLSCILEDDESECSASGSLSKTNATDSSTKIVQEPRKTNERDKNEANASLVDLRVTVPVTDIDEVPCGGLISRQDSEDSEEPSERCGFEITKLRSTDKLLERPVVVKRVEYSSDSSLDMSVSKSSDVRVEEMDPQEDTLSSTPENVFVEYESGDELGKERSEASTHTAVGEDADSTTLITEVVPDGETTEPESDLFQKVPKTYFEKPKDDPEADDEDEAIPDFLETGMDFEETIEDLPTNMDKKNVSFHSQESIHSEDRPPVPPETYLWEDLRRLKLKGGYPWTHLDKAPFDEAEWIKQRDHEYEPVNPPPPPNASERQDKMSIPDNERQFVRIPLDKDLVVQPSFEEEEEEEDAAMAEKTPEDLEVERIAAAQDLQDSIEHRFLGATPTTTASRTDCDVNTSMLDSSGLEDLPLNRGSRTKKAPLSKTEQMRAQAQGIQQKLRSQAGKLRNKLRSIPKPNFNLKEKDKENKPVKAEEGETHRSRFRLPDRPKFNLPERPKFSLPERPKFKLPDRPKFSLPERPKFSLPEKPKFNLPQRPKINFPSFGKSRTPRDRQQSAAATTGSRKNMFEFDFKTYPKMFNKKSKQRGDYATSSPKQTRGNTPPPKMRSEEAPVSPERTKELVGQKWSSRFDDIKYADEDAPDGDRAAGRDKDSRRSERSESLSDFRDKDLGCMEELEGTRLPPGRRTISTKSSMSHLSDREVQSSGSSEDRHRKGVLEEIDSDEFFLRQKGISQEDIDMGKYLTEEIREAFRSPVVNALAQMDYDYDDLEVEDGGEPHKEPPRPTRSLRKKSTISKTSESEILTENQRYKTYPPRRPGRKSRSQSKSNVNEEGIIPDKPRYENDFHADKQRYENDIPVDARYENVPDEDNVSDYYKTPGPAKEYQHYKVPRSDAPVVQPTPMKRKSSAKDKPAAKKKSEGWVEVEIETSVEEIIDETPQPLQRRKSKRSLKQASTEEWVTKDELQSQQEEKVAASAEPDYIIPDSPEDNAADKPVPPKRMRSLSRGRSLHSLKIEDETQQIADQKKPEAPNPATQQIADQKEPEPLSPETQPIADQKEPEAPSPETQPPPPAPVKTNHYETADDDMSFGYATVEKSPTLERPERSKKQKPPRPPPPRRRRATPSPTFNTLPSPRTPVRPVRNYSTLGPSRPPRKNPEHIYTDDIQSLAYAEINDNRLPLTDDPAPITLQTEEVIEKMKGRPLPPPPRPPRQRGKAGEDWQEDAMDLTEEDKISMAVLKGEVYPLEGLIQQEVAAFVHQPPQTQGSVEYIEEVCVSTQTDPLPDDFADGEEEPEMIQEFSHEQLKIQEAFLEEMRQEEERIQKEMESKRLNRTAGQMEERKVTSEVIKQIDEILAEEKRLLVERQKAEEARLAEERRLQQEQQLLEEQRRESERLEAERRRQDERIKREKAEQERQAEEWRLEEERRRQEEQRRREERRAAEERKRVEEEKQNQSLEVAEVDMGYASLDRRAGAGAGAGQPSTGAIPRSTRQAPAPYLVPDANTVVDVLKSNKLQVQELDVGKLNVNQLQANSITVTNLTGNRLHIEDISSAAGNLTLGALELPPNFIEQILARIPWDELRPLPAPASIPQAPTPTSTPVDTILPVFPAPHRRRVHLEQSDEEGVVHAVTPRRPHRSHRHSRQAAGYSSDEDEAEDRGRDVVPRRHPSRGQATITDLSQQLVRACTSAGVRAMRGFATRVRPALQPEDKAQQLKTVLCIVLVMIAGFFLLSFDTKSVHHYHWDFQFPPQPPAGPQA